MSGGSATLQINFLQKQNELRDQLHQQQVKKSTTDIYSGGDANSNYGNVTRPYSMQPTPSHPIHGNQNGSNDEHWKSHTEGRVGWGQNRFNVSQTRPISMPIESSIAGRILAESSSESEAQPVSSVSGKSGSKDKDNKSGMFRFLKSKKNGK